MVTRLINADKDNAPCAGRSVGSITIFLKLACYWWIHAGGCRSHELYGFPVTDIAKLIEQDSTRYSDSGDVGGTVDKARRYQLLYRYSYIRNSFRPFGYDFDFHPQFAARLVGLHTQSHTHTHTHTHTCCYEIDIPRFVSSLSLVYSTNEKMFSLCWFVMSVCLLTRLFRKLWMNVR